MGIVDAVCQHTEWTTEFQLSSRGSHAQQVKRMCMKPIKWQPGDPMRCPEHGGVSYHEVVEPEQTARWLLDIQIKRDGRSS